MKKSVQKRWNTLVRKGAEYQEMGTFFWYSDKTSDEEKFWLYGHLSSMEDMLNQSAEYNESQTEMAIIHMRLRIDAVQMFADSHPDLRREYNYSTNKKEGYRQWLRRYILEDPARELHIIGDRKAPKKFFELTRERVRG